MRTRFPQIVAFLALSIFLIGGTSTEPRTRCKDGERTALLKFKDSLHIAHWYSDETNNAGIVLSNWDAHEAKRECCEWIGIRCDNETGRVVALDLSPESLGLHEHTYLSGNQTSPSLAEMRGLIYLDLSCVQYGWKSTLISIGSLTELRYLNLSSAYFTGDVPARVGNLSNLQVLDLSDNLDLKIGNLSWASGLSSLRLLNLGYTNMSDTRDWLQVVNNLPSLTNLYLSNSGLQDASEFFFANYTSKGVAYLDLSWNRDLSNSTFKWLFNYSRSLVHLDISSCYFELASVPEGFADMDSLSYLDLSNNHIGGSIPEFFGTLTSLTHLDLSSNNIGGSIPRFFGNLTYLTHLNLHQNRFTGIIPESFGKLTSLDYLNLGYNMLQGKLPKSIVWEIHTLVYLDLSSNRLNGDVSKSIGKLSKLETLDLSENSIEAVMSEAHFEKLLRLSQLGLSSNKLIVLDFSSDWIPPFQLEYINLGSCKLGPRFPRWLETQKNYIVLNVSHSGISDYIPNWFWNQLSDGLTSLDLSNNELKGTIPDLVLKFTTPGNQIDLSSNQLEGHVPSFLLYVYGLNLHQNKFSDISSICNVSMFMPLEYLDISHNKLSGELPNCWSKMNNMETLILENNMFTGEIPNSIGDMALFILRLQLANNYFSGKLPTSLQNCTSLIVFDVGGNELTGKIPTWIGGSLQYLVFLNLRSNRFFGSLHRELCQLEKLQVLDLSSNNLSRKIPSCFDNLIAMRHIESVGYAQIAPYYVYGHGYSTKYGPHNGKDRRENFKT